MSLAKSSVLAASAVTLVASLGFARGEDGAAASLLRRMREAHERVSTLQARFEQSKSYPQLGLDDPPELGTLYVDRRRDDLRVRLEVTAPEPKSLIVANGVYLLVQPRIRRAVRGATRGGGPGHALSSFVTGELDIDALEREFRIELAEDDGSGQPGLKLEARRSSDSPCRRLDVRVDPTRYLPVRQRCHEANGTVVEVKLEETMIDRPLDASLFDTEPPPGVTVVEN